MRNPDARSACEAEWQKLLNAGKNGAWDPKKVRERRDVEANLRARQRRDQGERGRVRDLEGNDIDRSSGGAWSLGR